MRKVYEINGRKIIELELIGTDVFVCFRSELNSKYFVSCYLDITKKIRVQLDSNSSSSIIISDSITEVKTATNDNYPLMQFITDTILEFKKEYYESNLYKQSI